MASETITRNDLKAILDEVLPSVSNTEQTYITALNSITGGLRLTKDTSSKTVRAYGYFRRSTDINTSTVIFNVPEGYRPRNQYEIPMFLWTSASIGAAYWGVVATNGNIIQQFGSAVRDGFISAEWLY